MAFSASSAAARHAVRASVEAQCGQILRPCRMSVLRQTRTASEVGRMYVRQNVGGGQRSLCTTVAGHRHRYSIVLRDAKPRSESGFGTPRAMDCVVSRRTMATHAETQQPRRDSALSGPYDTYEAVVVGAGPAGITVVGNLLENGMEKILWVDESFNGGRVNQYYREVPSNTKAKLFIDFAQAVSPFRKIVSNIPSRDRWEEPSASDGEAVEGGKDKLQNLRTLDQEKGCQLSHAADMCLMLTQGLKQTPGVFTQTGRVAEATLDETSQAWSVNLDTTTQKSQNITNVKTKRLILCTGSTPLDPALPYEPAGLKHINLDDALSPTNLSALLSPLGPTTVAVIGASHSAILVLWNLAHLAQTSKSDLKVKWFTRHPLRYAEYEDGFIARDNTGLKGDAAVWAKDNLEPEKLPLSPVGKVIEKISYQKGDEEKVYRQHMDDAQFVVQAIGYARNQTPDLRLGSGEAVAEPVFDHNKGVFSYTTAKGEKAPLPGVYGAGIAFPQRVVDKKYGHEEYNVGFFKFMKAVKSWIGGWKPVA